MRNIYIMSGLPASGKSTYVDAHARIGDYVLHRDDYRAELRRKMDSDKYFPVPAKEEYAGWVKRITDCLKKAPGVDVWIDQTTLTQKSLNKLMNSIAPAIDPNNDVINIICIHTALNICMARNTKREGFARVPDKTILDMKLSMQLDPVEQARCRTYFPEWRWVIEHTNEME